MEHIEIGGFRPRIGAKILARCELLWVYKDRCNDALALRPGCLDQRHVPSVQGAHRRDETDPLPGLSATCQTTPKSGDCPHDTHPKPPAAYSKDKLAKLAK